MFTHVNILGVSLSRTSYHHGDLRNALIEAGAELAESGGPAAVTIRAAAAKAGVTPTAAYRHFADHAALLDAVRDQAMNRLSSAMGRYMRTVPKGDDAQDAMARLRATGRGYIQFAVSEPGLFHTAFTTGTKKMQPPRPGTPSPFGMLNDALDGLVAAGLMHERDRPLAELAAWSAVHGLAVLLTEGPLRGLSRRERDAVIDRSLTMIERGLTGG
jgi:AcrR family transcriptional regulator